MENWGSYYNRRVPGRGAGTILKAPDYEGMLARAAKTKNTRQSEKEALRSRWAEILKIKNTSWEEDFGVIGEDVNKFFKDAAKTYTDYNGNPPFEEEARVMNAKTDLMYRIDASTKDKVGADVWWKEMIAQRPNMTNEEEAKMQDEFKRWIEQGAGNRGSLPDFSRVPKQISIGKEIGGRFNSYLKQSSAVVNPNTGQLEETGYVSLGDDGVLRVGNSKGITQDRVNEFFSNQVINDARLRRQAQIDLENDDFLYEKFNGSVDEYLKSFGDNLGFRVQTVGGYKPGSSGGVSVVVGVPGQEKEAASFPVTTRQYGDASITAIYFDSNKAVDERSSITFTPTTGAYNVSGSASPAGGVVQGGNAIITPTAKTDITFKAGGQKLVTIKKGQPIANRFFASEGDYQEWLDNNKDSYYWYPYIQVYNPKQDMWIADNFKSQESFIRQNYGDIEVNGKKIPWFDYIMQQYELINEQRGTSIPSSKSYNQTKQSGNKPSNNKQSSGLKWE